MITNFDYLKKDSKFSRFADVAMSAEKIILMDPEASILNSRRAMARQKLSINIGKEAEDFEQT